MRLQYHDKFPVQLSASYQTTDNNNPAFEPIPVANAHLRLKTKIFFIIKNNLLYL